MPVTTPNRTTGRSMAAALAALSAGAVLAGEAGQVVYSTGAVSVQQGSTMRMAGRGDSIQEGDVVTTGSKAYAVVELKDGTRMTLRPDTVFGVSRFAHGAGEENAVLRLFKGGMRAVTGLIAKRNPQDGVRIDTATATIGIRGTDFDARLCGADCGEDARRGPAAVAQAVPAGGGAPVSPVAARVALVKGELKATGSDGNSRTVLAGGPIYSGDTLQTAGGSHAVLAFNDQSKVTLQSDTRFQVSDFRWDPAKPKESSAFFSLLKGGLRAVTGLLGRSDPSRVKFETSVATIGIRGTGIDALCTGLCAEGRPPAGQARGPGDGLFVHAWQGQAEIRAGNRTFLVDTHRVLFFAANTDRAIPLPQLPAFLRDNTAPRPDGVQVNFQQLFGTQSRDERQPGLYLTVRDGHVVLAQGERRLDLGAGESGFADPLGRELVRLDRSPGFLQLDPFPRPDRLGERPPAPFRAPGGNDECEM